MKYQQDFDAIGLGVIIGLLVALVVWWLAAYGWLTVVVE
jgi:hypothetical protein